MNTRTRRGRSEGGVVAIIVAVFSITMFGLAAMVVDLGHARDVKRQSQNAADAAALAAGNVLYGHSTTPHFSAAVQAAKDYAAANFGVTDSDWTTCTDSAPLRYSPNAAALTLPTTPTPCISFQNSVTSAKDLTRPDTVRVVIPTRRVDTPLGGAVGVSHVGIGTLAQASLNLQVGSACAFCVLGSGNHDLQNGGLTVSGGNIAFNGSVNVNNNGLVATDGAIDVQNAATGPLSSYQPDPTVGQPHVTDPLDFLPMPSWSSLTVKTNPCTDGPGNYGGVNLNNTTCNLTPGLYVIAGSGNTWDMSGNQSTSLNGTGVTLYFTCGTPAAPAQCASPGSTGANLDASGNAHLNLTAPTSGPLSGLTLIYDRFNTSQLRLTGEAGGAFTGTVYAPDSQLRLNGNACAGAFYSLIIVNDVDMNGNPTCMDSSYALSQNVDMPPNRLRLSQ